jgi:ABC-type sugar transport system permease subunit
MEKAFPLGGMILQSLICMVFIMHGIIILLIIKNIKNVPKEYYRDW